LYWKTQKKGFTLLELIIVLAIIVIVVGVSFTSLIRSQAQQIFNNNFDKIVSLISNARSQAITGKGQLDFTDFDNDKCNHNGAMTGGSCTSPDYVTPAFYGVYLDTAGGAKNVSLFADINPPLTGATGQKGIYNAGTSYTTGDDLLMDSLILPNNLTLEVSGAAAYSTGSIFFSPNYADVSFQTLVPNPLITIKLRETNPPRCRQVSIHKLAGVPEVGFCT
jgi:prepilin-type N-terminal cleavage/methylation domain-containing protein